MPHRVQVYNNKKLPPQITGQFSPYGHTCKIQVILVIRVESRIELLGIHLEVSVFFHREKDVCKSDKVEGDPTKFQLQQLD